MKPIAILLPFVIGCASYDQPSNVYAVFVDPAFGDKVSDVVDALDLWRSDIRAKSVPLTLQIIVEYRNCDRTCSDGIAIHPDTTANIRSRFGGGEEIGYCDRMWIKDPLGGHNEWSNVYVGSDMNDDKMWHKTLLHEIGHAFALEHTGKGTIMCKSMKCASEFPTCLDVLQYAELRGMSITCP